MDRGVPAFRKADAEYCRWLAAYMFLLHVLPRRFSAWLERLETSKYWGSTYVRYSSLDGKHKHIASPKGVFAVHCEEHSLDYETEYAKYDKAMKEKADAKKRDTEIEREVMQTLYIYHLTWSIRRSFIELRSGLPETLLPLSFNSAESEQVHVNNFENVLPQEQIK